VELSPRTAPGAAGTVTPTRRRSPWAYGALALVLLGIGVVAYQALSSASLYFYNADEAVAQRAQLGDRRIRLQGAVASAVDETADGVVFTVRFNGASVVVHHNGDPPELFERGIPVVLEGRWDESGDFFRSDRILVKHSEEYEAENQDRIADAEDATSGDTATP
jgi:cytochrome c-type biogenesis protein CcmE